MEPWCLLVALMSLDVGGAVTMKEPAEKKLHDHLLGERYSNLIRPTGNSSVKLTVKLGLRLSQLLEIVSTYQYYKYYFSDQYLTVIWHNVEYHLCALILYYITY